MPNRSLRYTQSFSQHALRMMTEHFEIPPDLGYLQEIDDQITARQYIRQLILPVQPVPGQAASQHYLRALFELPGPIFEAQRAARRLAAATPRPRTNRASTALIYAARDLAFEAYHFKERIKEHATTVQAVYRTKPRAIDHAKRLGRVVRVYEKANDRVLRHRNFLVHGPRSRHDEFSDLRLAELAAITLHDDLWFEHRNVFDEYKIDWLALAKALLTSMETGIAFIQVENENAMAAGQYSFVHKR